MEYHEIPCRNGYDHVYKPDGSICVLCYYNKEPTYDPETEKAIRKHRRRRASRISLYKRVIMNWGDSCVFCGEFADTGDHLIPRSRGGSSRLTNLRPCCTKCNQDKADYTPYEWLGEDCPEEFKNLKAPLPRKADLEDPESDTMKDAS